MYVVLFTIWRQVVKHPFDLIAIFFVLILFFVNKFLDFIKYIYKKVKNENIEQGN